MSISELDAYLQENPHLTQLVNGAPMIHSGRGMGKPDQGFRDLLKHIKKGNQKGISRSTINTFQVTVKEELWKKNTQQQKD